jgi:hypothetical protein
LRRSFPRDDRRWPPLDRPSPSTEPKLNDDNVSNEQKDTESLDTSDTLRTRRPPSRPPGPPGFYPPGRRPPYGPSEPLPPIPPPRQPRRTVQLAEAYVPWQVYQGYVRPHELPGPGTIFPELFRTPPLYKREI